MKNSLPKLFFLLLPVQLGYFFWPNFAFVWGVKIDFLAPVLYLTDLLAILLFFFFRIKISLADILLFLLFAGINIFFSLRPGLAIFRLIKLAEFLLLTGVVRQYFQKNWFLWLVIGLVVVDLLALGQFFSQSSLGGIFWLLGERRVDVATLGAAKIQLFDRLLLRPAGTFSHSNSLAGFLVVTSLLAVYFKKYFSHPLIKVWLLLNLVTLLLTFSAAAYLAVVLTGVIFLFHWRQKWGLVLGLPALLLAGWGLYQVGLLEPASLQKRWLLVKQAGQILLDFPAFGTGLGNFIPASAKLMIARRQFFAQPVHNIYLLWLAETGLLGLAFLFYWLKKLSWRFFLPLAVILFLGLFDHYWLTLQQNVLLFAVVIGVWQHQAARSMASLAS